MFFMCQLTCKIYSTILTCKLISNLRNKFYVFDENENESHVQCTYGFDLFLSIFSISLVYLLAATNNHFV